MGFQCKKSSSFFQTFFFVNFKTDFVKKTYFLPLWMGLNFGPKMTRKKKKKVYQRINSSNSHPARWYIILCWHWSSRSVFTSAHSDLRATLSPNLERRITLTCQQAVFKMHSHQTVQMCSLILSYTVCIIVIG